MGTRLECGHHNSVFEAAKVSEVLLENVLLLRMGDCVVDFDDPILPSGSVEC